jgi:hypothetical protein
MDIITGVKVVIAGLLVAGCIGLLWLLEQGLWTLPTLEAVVCQVLVIGGVVGITWYGLLGPGFCGTGKR